MFFFFKIKKSMYFILKKFGNFIYFMVKYMNLDIKFEKLLDEGDLIFL